MSVIYVQSILRQKWWQALIFNQSMSYLFCFTYDLCAVTLQW